MGVDERRLGGWRHDGSWPLAVQHPET